MATKNGFFDVNITDPNMIEPIIVKMCLSSIKYVFVLRGKFAKEWFNTKEIYGNLVEMIILFYDTYKRLPTLKDLAVKISVEIPEKDRTKYYQSIKSLNSLSLDDYTEEYLDKVCLDYIKSKGAACLVISNVDKLLNANDDTLETSLQLTKEISEIHSLSFKMETGFDYLEEIEEHCRKMQEDEQRLPTYWVRMDELMGGGMYCSEPCLVVFVGATHVGKSLTLSNLAANLINNNKFVLLISLEMGEQIYGNRIDAHLSGFSMKNLKENTEKIVEAVKKVKGENDKAKLVIKYFPTSTTCCNDFENYIKQLIAQEGRSPDIILIDYLTIVRPNSEKLANDTQSFTKYKRVAEEMRNLSFSFKCPVVTAAQLNREGSASSEPVGENIAESFGINATADFIGILYWRNKDTDRKDNIMYYDIVKNRLGGTFPKGERFRVDYSGSLRMSDISAMSPVSLINTINNTNGKTNNTNATNIVPEDEFANI